MKDFLNNINRIEETGKQCLTDNGFEVKSISFVHSIEKDAPFQLTAIASKDGKDYCFTMNLNESYFSTDNKAISLDMSKYKNDISYFKQIKEETKQKRLSQTPMDILSDKAEWVSYRISTYETKLLEIEAAIAELGTELSLLDNGEELSSRAKDFHYGEIESKENQAKEYLITINESINEFLDYAISNNIKELPKIENFNDYLTKDINSKLTGLKWI